MSFSTGPGNHFTSRLAAQVLGLAKYFVNSTIAMASALASLLGQPRASRSESIIKGLILSAKDTDEKSDTRAYPGSLHRKPGQQYRSMLDIEEPPILESIAIPEESMETWVAEKLSQAAQKHATTTNDWADILCFYTATNGVAPAAPTRAPAPVPNGKAVPPSQEVPQSVSSTDPKVAAQQASDMRNIVRRKLTGYVGFANLPNQWHRKSVRKGFNFNVMVVGTFIVHFSLIIFLQSLGESGLGKSTLVNTLFNTSLYPPRERKGPSLDIIPKTVSIQSISADIEENGVRLRLTVVDTPGFGDFVNNDESWRPIVDNIEQRFDAYLDAENKVNRMNIVDNRVHACVYFIQPTGHALKPLDIEVMRRLHTKVNLIPVIAKADTMTDEEIMAFKARVRQLFQIHRNHANVVRSLPISSTMLFKSSKVLATNWTMTRRLRKTMRSCQRSHSLLWEPIPRLQVPMDEKSEDVNTHGASLRLITRSTAISSNCAKCSFEHTWRSSRNTPTTPFMRTTDPRSSRLWVSLKIQVSLRRSTLLSSRKRSAHCTSRSLPRWRPR